jgi:hypothetical protein
MKPETKLKLRKRVLMALRSILWTADEWLHAAELRLRDDLARSEGLPTVVRSAAKRGPEVGARTPARVTYQEWEARKSGVATTPQKGARPRRRAHRGAADFDRELREHFSRSAS